MKRAIRILTTFVAAIGCIVATGTTEAQTVYIMTAFDSFDKEQRSAFYNDVRDFEQLWLYVNNTHSKGYRVYNEEKPWGNAPGDDWSGPELYNDRGWPPTAYDDFFERMLEGVRNCPAQSNDAIVVYWSGHGAFENGEHCLVSQNGTSLRRSKLLDAMKSRGARLTVLITDSCADYRDLSSQLWTLRPFPPQALPGTSGDDRVPPLFDKLFYRSSGVVDVNAAIESSKAWTVRLRTENGDFSCTGGCFTLALCGQYSWKELGISTSYLPAIVQKGARSYINAMTEIARAYNYNPSSIPRSISEAKVGGLLAFYNTEIEWSELMTYVQETTRVLAKTMCDREQQIAVWTIPARSFATPENASAYWSAANFFPEIGDVAVEFNGQAIRSASAFKSAAASASGTVVLKLIDARSGKRYFLRTNVGWGDQLGISVVDDSRGARIVGVRAGGPATRCQFKWE